MNWSKTWIKCSFCFRMTIQAKTLHGGQLLTSIMHELAKMSAKKCFLFVQKQECCWCNVEKWLNERDGTKSQLIKASSILHESYFPPLPQDDEWLKVSWDCPLLVTSLSASPAAPAGKPAVETQNRECNWCLAALELNFRVKRLFFTCNFKWLFMLSLAVTLENSEMGKVIMLRQQQPPTNCTSLNLNILLRIKLLKKGSQQAPYLSSKM